MSLLKGKYVDANNPLDGSKIKLNNNQALVGKKADGSAKEIIKVNASDKIEFLDSIQVPSDPTDPNDVAKKSYVDGKIEDAIVDGVTNKAPSQNKVFDALALKQDSLGTGTTKQFLKGDLTWGIPSKGARVFTVGIDANTIAGCIALCTSPTLSNNYVIEIPPGAYTENLTIPGCVHLKAMANPSDSLTVKITGQHTITGASANSLNNRVCIANIQFANSNSTTATFTISGSADTEVQFFGCFMDHTATASTSKTFSLGLYGKLYINNCKSRMAGSGQGGTHFVMAAGASLYTQYGLDVDGGTCVIDMTGQGYAQLQYAQLACQGSSAIKMAANGLIIMNQSSLTNAASVGNGVNLLGAGASFFASHSVFNILDNAASYVVTGVAGSAFGYYANNYSHIAGVAVRNVKIGASVSQLHYAGSLTSVDVNDFTAAARTAAVADAINDGTTNVAPSQNAVYDALALKLSTSLKGAPNGLAELDGDGKVPLSQIPSSVGAVQSVNSKTGTVVLNTDDIAELVSPTNKWFTDARAKAAVVQDSITDGVTDKAPSQNAVYDALALKLNQSTKGAANGVAELDAGGKVPSSQLPAIAITETYVVSSESAMLALTAQKGDVAVRTDLNKSFILAGTDPTVLGDWQELLTPTDAVISVNGQTGSVSLDSDDIAEGSTNKYFSASAAKSACVADSITDGVTDVAPSQNSVYDALAGKAASVHTHTASAITDFSSAAKIAAVVNSTAGSETDQAASVSAMKSYVSSAVGAVQVPTGKKQRIVLTSTDITNGYVDLSFQAMASTMIVQTGGVVHNEGSGDDYTVSVVGGVSRVTFEPDFKAILAAGDDIYFQYLVLA